jgi:hypothetical protein
VKNVFIVVEGYTEMEFIKNLVGPYLIQKGANLVHPFPVATNSELGKKGGGKTYKHLKQDLLKSVKYNPKKIVTTLFDYYALPDDFPGYLECHQLISVDTKLDCLEEAIKQDISPDNPLFLPYIQKHEFEALLFSSNSGFEYCFEANEAKETAKIIKDNSNPEEINDHPMTSPSKRLESIRPTYSKVLEGNTIALEVGIDKILEKCPRFRNWIENLVEIVQN